MVDYTKCKGEHCPLKTNCYRFTSSEDEYWQSWFALPPYENDTCEYYLGE